MSTSVPSLSANEPTVGGLPILSKKRHAVIDLGSNSIRLVVYDGITRFPHQIFNEKSMCGLGRSLHDTGKLDEKGTVQALETLKRFRRLMDGMDLETVDVVATAAIRDADDGPNFLAAARTALDAPIHVLSGLEEAELSSLGVLGAFPKVNGIAADLGGASMEVTQIRQRQIKNHISLPLGPLRLNASSPEVETQEHIIDKAFAKIDWIEAEEGRRLYAVGGAWRALAKAYMHRVRHPLHIVHNFEIEADRAYEFLTHIALKTPDSLDDWPGLPGRRLETIPCAARLMRKLLEAMQAKSVVFSAYGLREGVLFNHLERETLEDDPLMVYCRHRAHRTGRFGDAEHLVRWLDGLFPDESKKERRLREAACLLSDTGWAYHPDYRAEQAHDQVLLMPAVGIDHPGRAFLATAIFYRYGGKPIEVIETAQRLLGLDGFMKAQALGLALRLAYTVTGTSLALLANSELTVEGDTLSLYLSKENGRLVGDSVDKHLGKLAKLLGKKAYVTVDALTPSERL